MTDIRFEWDPVKDLVNQRKHGLSFEEAAQVFRDPLHVSIQDRVEGGELRWQTFGMIAGALIVIVAHTVRDEDEDGDPVEVIRIISARKATRHERRRYENANG